MRFATWEIDGTVTTGVAGPDGLHAFADQRPILEIVRQGLPAALEAGTAALRSSPITFEAARLLPPLNPPTVRDFAAFAEHIDGVSRLVTGEGGVIPEWYEAPVFYFSNPYAMIGAYDDVAVPPAATCSIMSWRLPPSSRGMARRSLLMTREAIFSATQSSTTGPLATSRHAR